MKNIIKATVVRDGFAVICTIFWFNPMFQIINPIVIIIPIVLWMFLAYITRRAMFMEILLLPCMRIYYIYVLVILVNHYMKRAQLNSHELLFAVIIIFGTYYIKLDDIKRIKTILFFGLIYIGAIVLISFYYLNTQPDLMRILGSGSDEVFKEYANSFTASYSTVYVLAVLIPLLFGLAKYKRKYVNVIIICGLGIAFLLQAQYTTAILLVMIFSIINIWGVSNKKINFGIVFLAFIGLLLLINLKEILEFFIALFNGNTVAKRMNELLRMVNSRTILKHGDSTNRLKYFIASFNSFKNNIFFGMGYKSEYFMKSYGGHSSFMDIFAEYGLIGGAPYWCTVILLYKQIAKCLEKKYKKLWVIVFIEVFALAILNITTNVLMYFGFFAFIPMLIIYEQKSEMAVEKKRRYAGR